MAHERQGRLLPLLHPVPVSDPDMHRAIEGFRAEIQAHLLLLTEQMDRMSGLRGTPRLYAPLDAGGHALTNVGVPQQDTDVQLAGLALAKNAQRTAYDAKGLSIQNLPIAQVNGQAVPLEQLNALIAAQLVAIAAINAPPEVEDTGVLGTVATRFARENHTHSGVNKSDAQTGIAGAKTWTALATFSAGLTFGNETIDLYDEDTATVTGTGFTVNPTGTARFVILEKMVLLFLPELTGTSNATTFTMTGIPTIIQPTRTSFHLVRLADNSVDILGVLRLNAGSGTIDLFASVALGAFTAALTKTLYQTWIPYALL